MRFHPILEGQLVLCQLGKDFRFLVAGAKLGGHVRNHLGDAGVVRVLVEGFKEIQLGVFLDLHAQVVQLLDGRVAGQEVQGARAEADDLQVLKRIDGARDRKEFVDHIRAVFRVANGVLRDIGLHVTKSQVVAGV